MSRVLVFRSCRTPQFAAAVEQVRRLHPEAEIVAFTHDEFVDDVQVTGVDRVITHRAPHLTIAHLGLRMIRQLRQFDAVVFPLMDSELRSAANLLRLAALINAPSTAFCVDGGPLRTLGRISIVRRATLATLGCTESILMLWQLLCAACRLRPSNGTTRSSAIRVLHIISSLGMGGAQKQCLELISGMPVGTEADILVLADDRAFSLANWERSDVPVTFLRRGQLPGETIIDTIADHCRRGRYDVVHTWLTNANIAGAAAARLAGVGRIVTSVRAMNPANFPEWYQWWFRPGDVLASRIADSVTVNSRPLIADHARWALMPSSRIEVVHNGLDPSSLEIDIPSARAALRSELKLSGDAPLIGCIGRLSCEKDQATFVRALGQLMVTGQSFHAVVVGEGKEEAALRALAAGLQLGDHVTFLGARIDARQIIAGLDVLALTSRSEGFPNVLLEAGFLGVPIVSTKAGGVVDVVGSADGLCAVGDADAVAYDLTAVLANRTLATARAMRQLARCRELFTTEKMVSRWRSAYGLSVERIGAVSSAQISGSSLVG